MHVTVHGLDEFARDVKRAAPEIRKGLQKDLREILKGVVREAKSQAKSVARSSPTGDMESQIRPSVRGTTGYVRATAEHRGFNYPVRFEFGDYHRPFLEPAIRSQEGEIVKGIEQAVDKALDRLNL